VSCLACGSLATETLLHLGSVPVVANELYDTASEAVQAAKGEMTIVHCKHCHHFFNSSFDASLVSYSSNYETSLHYSEVFQAYTANVVKKLTADYGVTNARILEVGCGRGDFLNQLCEAGDNVGLGFDTSFEAGRTIAELHDNVTVQTEYFGAETTLSPVDLVVSQQVLEHVGDPTAFLETLVNHPAVAGRDALLYLEVPNGLYTFANDGIWDLIYEHVSYFSPDSLRSIVERSGCEILEEGSAFGGQYLFLIASISANAADPRALAPETQSEMYTFVDGFASRLKAKVDSFATLLRTNPSSTYIWGAGSKGITFCNLLDTDCQLGGLVDRHPRKVDRFIPGTGLKVISPLDLASTNVEQIIVMNPLYTEEIRYDLERAGVEVALIDA